MRASGFVPVEANLQRPRMREGLAVRGELVDTLREQSGVPIVLITGPPGYGKTTLLAQWCAEDERPFAFVTVDETSNDPTVLVTYVMLALQRLGPSDIESVDGGVLGAVADNSAVSTVLLPRLGRMLAHRREPFVLVVDDAESLSSPAAFDVLMMVARHLKEGSQLVISARTPPKLPLSRLRTEHRLLLLGPDDLRMTAAETRAVLAAAGLDLSPDDVLALLERTEGWAAGIYLAALSLRDAARRRDELFTFGGPGTVVADYLRDEVLAAMTPERQRFLVRTAILSRMCGPLCDAVLDACGSGQVLRELEHSNLFVVPIDAQGMWFRYHNVFRDMLTVEVSREDPQVVTGLHSRASRWFEAAGDIEEAIRHAHAAHEVDRAARLIWSQSGAYLATGRIETVRRWLDGFASDEVIGQARLALTAAWCALESGRPVDHWIAAAARAAAGEIGRRDADSVRSSIALLRAARARDGIEQMRSDARTAEGLQAPDDPWRAFTQYLLAVAELLTGDAATAHDMLEATNALAAALRLPSHQALCLAQLAVLAIERGDWRRAGALVDAACDLLADNAISETSSSAALVHCVATLVLAARGHVEDARRRARQSTRLISAINQCPPWLAVETRYLLGRAQLLTGDTSAARVLLSEAQAHLRDTPDAGRLRASLDDACTQAEAFPLANGMGPAALTTAELRVLQLLPTHLSFEEIGKHLLVSRNTVKTQAIAAYRKLGVSSRAAAVDRATKLGMIQS